MNQILNPPLTSCPVCDQTLAVTRLGCEGCGTTIEGRFAPGPFAGLSPQQLAFVAAFVRREGKLSHLEAELGLSYPTLRSRLQEVIRAMDLPRAAPDRPAEPAASAATRRRDILDALETGSINAEEAIDLLRESEA
ncbi:MAG TPA: DUF2089 domain-containing protein [Anaerolineae bacterium]|jgi:hypothetical protein|nr:DUF2089 domain-containing protein [Ardenticatenia bacterium]MBK8540926.1 DUF2089 domain-containing protein [Ardenticatenia bacterium]HQZ69878.1 DUF2089 domain-containing protein [Anaerolineae bacterium]HRA20710.1 DUF2089 domain-containing protein [Anaerolineae bacterium]